MKNYQKHKTSKCFYNIYPYKVTTQIKCASILKNYGLKWKMAEIDILNRLVSLTPNEVKKFSKYLKVLKNLPYDNMKLRAEGSTLNLFLKEKKEFDDVISKLKEFVVGVWEPANEQELKLINENHKNVIVDNYPHGIYKSKVIFNNLNPDQRLSLHSWLRKYPISTFKISRTTENYLIGKRHYAQDPFILVNDSKMLTMLLLSMDKHVRRVEHFILRSSINTQS